MPAPSSTSPVDVLGRDGRVLGHAPRGRVLQDGLGFRTVHVLVLDGRGGLWVQRLAAGRPRHGGLLGSSVAGYVHAGEDVADAAARRAEEELGVRSPLRAVGTVRVPDGSSMKFVSVFEAEAATIAVREEAAAEEVVSLPLSEVEHGVARRPQDWTPTFVSVFTYWQGRRGAAPTRVPGDGGA